MIIKLIVFLFGRLTIEQKQELLDILTQLVKAGAEGATQGLVQGATNKSNRQ